MCLNNYRPDYKKILCEYSTELEYMNAEGGLCNDLDLILNCKVDKLSCSPLHPVALLFSMGGVALVSFSSMDNPDGKGVIGKHGGSDQ